MYRIVIVIIFSPAKTWDINLFVYHVNTIAVFSGRKM